jgi:Arc/MetJ family transcription regulator
MERMGMVARDERVKQACAYLRLLVLRPGEYRDRWAGEHSHDPVEIDHNAVADVLRAAGTPTDPDTVRRALTGVELTPDLLEAFIAAFRLSPRHAGRLRDVLRGTEAARVITGEAVGPAELYERTGPPGYETLALHEMHTLGPDGRPAEHQTIQVIRSTVDRLESYPYRFDTDELSVEVTRGGKVGQRIYRVNELLHAVDIVLDRPLSRGESSLLQMYSTFFYDSPPPTEFRRGLARATKDVSIWVTFHPHRLPSRVWAASWDALDDDGRIISREAAELDSERSVNRRFDVVERAIVGFCWEW